MPDVVMINGCSARDLASWGGAAAFPPTRPTALCPKLHPLHSSKSQISLPFQTAFSLWSFCVSSILNCTAEIRAKMSQEYDESNMGEDGGMTGPGAPTPLSALEVWLLCSMVFRGH